MTSIDVEQIRELLRGRMGLVLGPSASRSPGLLTRLSQALAEQFGVEVSTSSFLVTCDRVIEKGTPPDDLRTTIADFVNKESTSPLVTHLSKGKWSAILSGALDTEFESSLQREADQRPTRKDVAVVNNLTETIPFRSLPVLKLLGTTTRDDFVCSTPTYVKRKAAWRRCFPDFADRVRGNPVMCLGLDDCEWMLLDVLAELASDPTSAPSLLLITADSGLANSPHLSELLRGRTRLAVLSGSVSELVSAITAADKKGYSGSLGFDIERTDYSTLQRFADVVTVVNEHLTTAVAATEQNLLRDVLFAPTVPRWEPFVHNFDFRRTVESEILDEIRAQFSRRNRESFAATILGSSASGKSTLAKRIAWELASSGHLVLWCKPCFFPDPARIIRKLLDTVSKLERDAAEHVVVVIDDPLAMGSISPRAFSIAAEEVGVRIALLSCARQTDWISQERNTFVGNLPIESETALDDELTQDEMDRLPQYLVRLGIATDTESAQESCERIAQRTTSDTLGMLYYLLPQTRHAIESSVKSEYFRLGDTAGLRRVIIGAHEHSSALLKQAYEMVAVAEHYRAPLPIEVLVAALQVDYGPWLAAARADGPAWGVLYSHQSEDGSECYRTRNAIVAQMLVDTLNGSLMSHSGEVTTLLKLMRACESRTSSVYREFCIQILVPNSKLEKLEYEEGLQLYDAAIEFLPFPDKTLVHQKGLWIKNRGSDPELADKILQDALDTPVYPYTERGEADQHIHNSIAANAIDSFDNGTKPLEETKADVMQHLALARSSEFFNPRAVHVQGNLVMRLCKAMGDSNAGDTLGLVNNAVADIDRSLLVLDNPVRTGWRSFEDSNALKDIRARLFDAASSSIDIETEAEKLWEQFRIQEGFTLLLRKRYEHAKETNKGKDFRKAYEFFEQVKSRIEEQQVPVDPKLVEVALHLYFDWRVTRATYSSLEVEIDWEVLLQHSQRCLQIREVGNNAFYRYVNALSLAHLGDWTKASTVFLEIQAMAMPKPVLWTPRGFLLQEKGGPRKVQGVIRRGSGKHWLHVEDFGTDFYLDSRGNWPQDGEIAFAYIQLSFGGPKAVEDFA